MMRYSLVFLLGSLSWGQATGSQFGTAAQTSAAPAIPTSTIIASDDNQQVKISNLAPDAPVITISGFCDNPPADVTAASNCKTVITRAQFEKVIDAIQPNMSARARREFALRYSDALVMAKKAEQLGLDKGANYEEQMKFARIQVLFRELNKAIQEKASQISDKDIEDYYYNNKARFEKAEMDRIFVPKARQLAAPSDTTLSDADRQERSQESERTMKKEAESLLARAVAGEEFATLQADAYQVAGIKNSVPNTSMVIRRSSLPPNQVSAMDLKPGEVSSVLTDPAGYVIYKVKAKDVLPLDQSRDEIKVTLRSQRMQDEMRAIQGSATPALDEVYFRRRLPQGMMRAGEPSQPASKPDSRKPTDQE